MLFDDCLTDLYNSALNTDYDATKGIYSDLINGIIDECEFEELLEDVIIENRQAGMLGLAGSDGQPYVMLTFDAPLFGIWSPAGKNAPFICLEPWYGRSDAVDFNGTLENREYEQCLDGGQSFETSYQITVCN